MLPISYIYCSFCSSTSLSTFFQNVLRAFYEFSSANQIHMGKLWNQTWSKWESKHARHPFIGKNHSRAKFWGGEWGTSWPLCEKWTPWFGQASWLPSSQTVAKVAVPLVDWFCGIVVGSAPGPGYRLLPCPFQWFCGWLTSRTPTAFSFLWSGWPSITESWLARRLCLSSVHATPCQSAFSVRSTSMWFSIIFSILS